MGYDSFDPSTDTMSPYYGRKRPPETPLQRQWAALGTTLLVVLLAPVWLIYKGYEKCQEWRQDRAYASQEEVLKQPPLAVMVCKIGCSYEAEELAKLRVVSRQPSQEDGEKADLLVLAPSKGEKNEWITCELKAGDSFTLEPGELGQAHGLSNCWACTTVCCLFEGPDAWEQARPIGNLPEKPCHRYGDAHCVNHPIREEANLSDSGSYVTVWYNYHSTVYVYQDGCGLEGFWRAKPADEVYLEAMRRAR